MKSILVFLSVFLLMSVLASCAGKSAGSVGPIKLYYEENAQVEIIDSSGQRILVDIYNPEKLSSEATAKDVLLTTHSHNDHLNQTFIDTFTGPTLTMKTGDLTAVGFKIHGFAGSHNGAAPQDINGEGSNYVFIVDTGELRVAHFGDLGQDALTPAQLDALGRVDVAVMQFSNSYSGMSQDNKKGFNLADQVKPRVIIPTHFDDQSIKYAVEKWKAAFSAGPLTLTANNLPKETTIVLMGELADLYGKAFKLSEWGK